MIEVQQAAVATKGGRADAMPTPLISVTANSTPSLDARSSSPTNRRVVQQQQQQQQQQQLTPLQLMQQKLQEEAMREQVLAQQGCSFISYA